VDVDERDFKRIICVPMYFSNLECSGLKDDGLPDTRNRRPSAVDGLIGTKVKVNVNHTCVTISSNLRTEQTSEKDYGVSAFVPSTKQEMFQNKHNNSEYDEAKERESAAPIFVECEAPWKAVGQPAVEDFYQVAAAVTSEGTDRQRHECFPRAFWLGAHGEGQESGVALIQSSSNSMPAN
jgi:hypothetical protein